MHNAQDLRLKLKLKKIKTSCTFLLKNYVANVVKEQNIIIQLYSYKCW